LIFIDREVRSQYTATMATLRKRKYLATKIIIDFTGSV
jgi:hypothetical protein